VPSALALDRLSEVVAQLEGVSIPASILARDVLAARIPGYVPRLLDELGSAGEVCWVGCGRLGRDDGRIALYRPGRLTLLAGPQAWAGSAAGAVAGAGEPGEPGEPAGAGGWIGEAIRGHLARRGASFYRDLHAAVLEAARAGGERAPSQRELLDALWDLAWAGLVTNDTFAPLRALRWRRGTGEPRPRGVRLVPPEAAGRWSLVESGAAEAGGVAIAGGRADMERRHALALSLLERQGIVTRDGVAAEVIPGGFAAVYPVLREMEERGRVRRGYFVEGLGGAQFALPGAVDALRAERGLPGGGDAAGDDAGGRGPRALVLAAADPAQPYGGVLPWPRRGENDRRPLARVPGAFVVMVDGEPVLYVERGGRSLQTLPAFDSPGAASFALRALGQLVADGRLRNVQVERIDAEPPASSRHREALEAAGFRRGYRGWILTPAAGSGGTPGARG
jgi:ATP-dependent Lhr-like helicase